MEIRGSNLNGRHCAYVIILAAGTTLSSSAWAENWGGVAVIGMLVGLAPAWIPGLIGGMVFAMRPKIGLGKALATMLLGVTFLILVWALGVLWSGKAFDPKEFAEVLVLYLTLALVVFSIPWMGTRGLARSLRWVARRGRDLADKYSL